MILNDQVLTRVTSTRILGVIIDDRLTWSPHIDFVIRKTCAKVGALRRSFRQLSRKARRQFIVSVILPDLLYCCSCFVTKLSAKDRQRLSTVFRRAVRAACGAKSQDDITPLLTTLAIYPFEHYMILNFAQFNHRNHVIISLPTLTELFPPITTGLRTRSPWPAIKDI